MAEPFANTGFDPLFGDPLQRLIAKAAEQGIPAHIISGVRTDEDQRQLVANAAATRAGQPLPYPKRGPVPAAAPVGQSAHEYGLAGDVQADNPADQPKLIALGTSLGLSHPMPYDPTHFEAPNWRQTAATQAPPTPWSQVADVPSSYAENVDSSAAPAAAAINAAAPPGLSLNTTTPDRLASMVGTLESGGGRFSSAQPKSMVDPLYGQYPGFAKSYGRGAAGIDNYAQAVLAANPKASVGDFYAGYFSGTGKPGSPNFNNFDRLSKGIIQDTPGSAAAQQAAAANFVNHAGVDPSTPLASVVGAPAPPQPPVEGATGAIDPSIMAHQSTTPAVTAPPSIASQVAGPLQALTKGLEDSGDQKQQAAPDQSAQLQAQQAAAGYGMQRQQELRARAEQLMASILAQGQRPLSWNSAPPGSGAGLQIMAPQTPTPGGGYVGGTSLNSMGDYYG